MCRLKILHLQHYIRYRLASLALCYVGLSVWIESKCYISASITLSCLFFCFFKFRMHRGLVSISSKLYFIFIWSSSLKFKTLDFPYVFLQPATVDCFSHENKNFIGLFKMFKSSFNIFIFFMQWIVFFISPSSFSSSSSSRETSRLFQANQEM